MSLSHLKKKFKELRSQCDMSCPEKGKYDIALFRSIYDTPYENWNKVLQGDNLLLSIPYLAAMEADPARQMEFHYAIVYRSSVPQAILYFQEFDFRLKSLKQNVDVDKVENSVGLMQKVKNVVMKSVEDISFRLLTFGNTFISGEHGFHVTDNFDKSDLGRVINDTIEKVCHSDEKKNKVSGLLVKDFYPTTLDSLKNIVEHHHQFRVQPNMVLPMDKSWVTFDDYLAAMSSKYRVRAKSAAKKGADLKVVEFDAETIEKNNERILELYNGVEGSADFQLVTIGNEYFFELKVALEDNFKFHAYYLNNEIIGFATTFIQGEQMEAHYVGIDYSKNEKIALYQNMLYDYVKCGLKHRVKEISFGRTALEIKSAIGAEPKEMHLFVRHTNSVSHKIIQPFIENIRQEEWIQRHPFKKNGESPQNSKSKKVRTEIRKAG